MPAEFGSHSIGRGQTKNQNRRAERRSPRPRRLFGARHRQRRAKLGKHKRGKGCLYIDKLDDVDRGVLRELIEQSIAELRKRTATKRG
jgi:hypothetical protein